MELAVFSLMLKLSVSSGKMSKLLRLDFYEIYFPLNATIMARVSVSLKVKKIQFEYSSRELGIREKHDEEKKGLEIHWESESREVGYVLFIIFVNFS